MIPSLKLVAGIAAAFCFTHSARATGLLSSDSGLLNKQIDAHLDAAETTIKVRRGQVMKKMKAESLAFLIHIG